MAVKKKAAAKAATKKAPAAKAATKKAPAAKAATKKAPAAKRNIKLGDKPPTKTGLIELIADDSGVARKDVAAVLASLGEIAPKALKKHGTFSIAGMLKMKTVKKPATKARKGINPFTGQEAVFAAKPARTVVKVAALKALKDKL